MSYLKLFRIVYYRNILEEVNELKIKKKKKLNCNMIHCNVVRT